MKAVALLILEILNQKLKSNLAFFLTMSISKALAFQTPDFDKMLLNLRSRITRDLEAVAVVVDQILTVKLNSNLAFFLNMSISILFLVQAPHFTKRLLKEGQRITLDMKAVAVLILEILARKLNTSLAFFSNFEEIESVCIPDTRL